MNKLFALIVLLFSLKSFSLETDQYMTWDIELENAKPFVNKFINAHTEAVLEEINNKNPNIKCEKVAIKALEWNGRTTDFLSLIEKTMYEHPEERDGPAINVSQRGVVEESIYADVEFFKKKVFGVNVQLDGIYMGTDKLGHFVTVGLSYYKNTSFTKSLENLKRKLFEKQLDEESSLSKLIMEISSVVSFLLLT